MSTITEAETKFTRLLSTVTDESARARLLSRVALNAMQDAPEDAFKRDGLLGQRVALGSLVRDGVPPTPWLESGTLGLRLFYAESVWIVSGHKKSGKSWAMLATALDCVTAERPVVYIDFENGHKRLARRLIQLGADWKAVDRHLHYIDSPRRLTLDGMRAELDAIAEALPNAFVVIDSLRGYMARLSTSARALDPNAAADVEAVCAPLNDAAHEHGLTVGVIDHAKKGASDSDEYSTSGSQAKEAAVDAVYFWTKVENYNKETAGLVKIAATSDRDGELDFERFYRVGGQGEAAFSFERADADEVGTMGKVRASVYDFLADHEGQTFTANAIVGSAETTGKAEHIRRALELMAAGERHIHKDPNPARKGSWLYSYDGKRDGHPVGALPLGDGS